MQGGGFSTAASCVFAAAICHLAQGQTFMILGGHGQWAPNEKVAFEVGLGSAFGGAVFGARTLVQSVGGFQAAPNPPASSSENQSHTNGY